MLQMIDFPNGNSTSKWGIHGESVVFFCFFQFAAKYGTFILKLVSSTWGKWSHFCSVSQFNHVESISKHTCWKLKVIWICIFYTHIFSVMVIPSFFRAWRNAFGLLDLTPSASASGGLLRRGCGKQGFTVVGVSGISVGLSLQMCRTSSARCGRVCEDIAFITAVDSPWQHKPNTFSIEFQASRLLWNQVTARITWEVIQNLQMLWISKFRCFTTFLSK